MLNGLEEQKRIGSKLAALDRHLKVETTVLHENHDDHKQELETLQKEKQRIYLEERSNTYWLRRDEHTSAASKLAEAEKKSQENEDKLEATKQAGKIMQAAGLSVELRQKTAELCGIHERLVASRSQYETDERMRNLEYSLRKLAQESLEVLKLDLARLSEEKTTQNTILTQERAIKARLKLNLSRNLLGELSESDLEKARRELNKTQADLQIEGQRRVEERTRLEQKQLEAYQELQGLQEASLNEKNVLLGLKREITDYEQQEEEIQGILQKYGFDVELRFDKERLHTTFNQRLKTLDQPLQEAARIRDDATESLASLKNGRLHIPEELIALLAKQDIPYDTGETYLRNQSPEIRQTLLARNPVLPYALILAKENIARLAESMNSLTMRRIIPIIAYEDLSVSLTTMTDRWVQAGEGVALVCLYEGRVFDNAGLISLEEELNQKQTDAMEQYLHYSEERNQTVAKQTICERFVYKEDYRYLLGKRKTTSEKQLQTILSRMDHLDTEKMALRTAQKELEQTLKETKESLQKAQAAIETFEAWIEQEKDYQTCRRRLAEISEAITGATGRKAELVASRDKLQEEIVRLSSEIKQKERESREIQKKYTLYQEAPEAELVEGTLEELEERLKALKATYSGEIEQLENRKQELQSECEKKEKEITKLSLTEQDYRGVIYDEGTAEELSAEIIFSLDSSDAAGLRMKDYIEACIYKVREETRQEKSEEDVKKSVAKLMYSRELLNVYLGNSNIPVKVFKIDLNMQNSSLKTWEDAMRENSGGEKFVVYFSVLSALMAYTRSRTLEAAGADEDKDSSVLVMDNPFGPISSEHLLNPLFEIAKKHRTQLICLSDLKQNSIMNCFNFIYMLKVRTSAIGSNEYLKFEEHIRDENAIQYDEKLEKAIFRVLETKQINLF